MRSPYEGPTASRFSLRRPRGPRKFVAASLAIDILSRAGFREEIPFQASAVHTTRYHFVVSSPEEGPTGGRGLLARGAYWPQGEALAPVASPLATPLKSRLLPVFTCILALSASYFGSFARRALVRSRIPMILCLSNARSGDLHFGTSFVALRALVREIIPNTIHTYIPTHIHT